MGDAASCIGCANGLMNYGRRLRRRGNRFGVKRDVAKQQIRLGSLNKIRPVHFSRHVAGDREHRGMISSCLIEAGDEVRTSGPGRATTHPKLTGELGLTGGG